MGDPIRTKAKKSYLKKAKKADLSGLRRQVLYRPDRMSYVRKTAREPGCVFCTAAAGAISFESLVLWKSSHSMVVMNKYPYNNGHLLILPQRHEGHLLALDSEAYLDLSLTLKKAVQAINECFQPPGFNIGLNHGACSGAGIPDHLHYHLIPRWSGDTNFFPLIAHTKVVVETLEQTYERLTPYFR